MPHTVLELPAQGQMLRMDLERIAQVRTPSMAPPELTAPVRTWHTVLLGARVLGRTWCTTAQQLPQWPVATERGPQVHFRTAPTSLDAQRTIRTSPASHRIPAARRLSEQQSLKTRFRSRSFLRICKSLNPSHGHTASQSLSSPFHSFVLTLETLLSRKTIII